MSLDTILGEVKSERVYQDKKWGHKVDDSLNSPNDWVTYICNYASKWFPGGFPPYNENVVEDFRAKMIKTAALAVAAVESIDRQRDTHGKPFYQNSKSTAA